MQNNVTIDGFEIATWQSDPDIDLPYQAVNMTVAIEFLEGYGLTEEEKTSLPALMAGYCRLIEESKLVGFGDTEFEAIQDLFSHATKTNNG